MMKERINNYVLIFPTYSSEKINFVSFENFLKIDIRETGSNMHFDRASINQSECRKLQGHIIIEFYFTVILTIDIGYEYL